MSKKDDTMRSIMIESAVQSQLNNQKKSAMTFALLALFLGLVGAHRAYMGNPGLILVYMFGTIVCAPVVLIIVLFEICLCSKITKEYNENLEKEIRAKLTLQYGL